MTVEAAEVTQVQVPLTLISPLHFRENLSKEVTQASIMSGRVGKTRGSTANIESATTTVNERILKVSRQS